ncbi:MAG TPA: pyridoxamine 5'-phosphate oxidase family protein [Acidimicrobiales bacterium]|nr:pyridoxamine 5'-phosphate oxidase family protein [Acidimicrobiales bacterium]
MNKRDQIRMSGAEVDAFLREPHHLQVATIGRDGRPHLVAMWYGFLGDVPALWTYGRSQKVVNLRRDPRLTCLAETGRAYDELRGVELVANGTILDEMDTVLEVGRSVFERYMGAFTEQAAARMERMSAKRVAVRIDVERLVSWDHRKLAALG